MNQAQMKWMNGILYLKNTPDENWVHYTQSSYYKPDYQIPNGSKGYATMQHALKCGATFNQDTVNITE